jgi:hypothetical protein
MVSGGLSGVLGLYGEGWDGETDREREREREICKRDTP